MRIRQVNSALSRVLPVIFFFLFTQTFLSAQATLCGGSLGSNIFSGGDFGSGSTTIYPEDPKLAPGFLYTTQVPPGDGRYTLTNDMSKWPSIWSTWLPIGDNSEDPDGYMMVVNASETPGIFYEQLIDNVCENTLYEFSADAINLIRNGTGGHILPDISFYINDVLQYTTGPIPQDEKWHTYGFTFTSGPGQSTLKLTLRNNAPGGGGNDLALDNIAFLACGPEANIDLQAGGKFCENELPVLTAQIDADSGYVQWQMSEDSLLWNDLENDNNMSYQAHDLQPGNYYFRYLYANTLSNLANSKCRIISAPISFEILPSYYTATGFVCEGVGYAFGDSVYDKAGFYQHSFTREGQCDSVVTLELILVPDPGIMTDYEITPTSCEGAADGTVRILSVSGAEGPYTLTFDGAEVSPKAKLVMPGGIFTTVVTDKYGCFDRQELIVPDGPPLQVKTIEDTSLLWGYRFEFTTTTNMPVSNVKWTPAHNMDCATCLSPQVILKDDMTYIVEAKTASGCEARDSVSIIITHKPVRYVPNVFSPNNDHVNDYFEIFLESVSFRSIDRIVVFDRWGSLIHQQSNLSPIDVLKVWDGTSARGPVSTGVYFYSIDYTLIDGSRENVKGDVTVMR
jgi:gliding motility-associated-like protein